MADYEVIPKLDPRAQYGGFSVDMGGGHALVPKSTSYTATGPAPHVPPPVAVGGGPSGALPEQAVPSLRPIVVAIPIYLWMGMLALLVAYAVSGSLGAVPQGLHLHPVYGVAAGFAVVGLYRYLMTWFPTAVLVTAASSSLWAALFWAWRHADRLRDLPTAKGQALRAVTTLARRFTDDMRRGPDPWVVGIATAAVVLHLLYWRHRRAEAAAHGWLFNRGAAHAARTLGALAVAAGAVGWVISFLARWSR